MESLQLAQKISEFAAEVKAINIHILDLRNLSSFTDFFIVCSGSSDRQLRAIADKVMDSLKKEGIRPISKEGYEQGEWVLVDYADVVLHIFSEQARSHYDLEGFWNRALHITSRKKIPQKRKKPSQKSKSTRSKKKTSSKAPSLKKKKK